MIEEADADWLCAEALARLTQGRTSLEDDGMEEVIQLVYEALRPPQQDVRWLFRYAWLTTAMPERPRRDRVDARPERAVAGAAQRQPAAT